MTIRFVGLSTLHQEPTLSRFLKQLEDGDDFTLFYKKRVVGYVHADLRPAPRPAKVDPPEQKP